MRRFIRLLAGIAAISVAGVASAATYPGNGATGFGGPIGNGSIDVTDNGAGNLTFTVNPAGGNLGGNAAVLYLDTQPGGAADTAGLSDTADGGRSIVSGVNAGNPSRSVVTFPAGFGADYGIAIEPNVFEGVFDINNTPANFNFVTGNAIATNGPYSVTVTRAQLGLGPTDPFSFVGNELSF